MLDWKYRPKTDEERVAETEKKAQKEREKEEKPEGFASKNANFICSIEPPIFLYEYSIPHILPSDKREC